MEPEKASPDTWATSTRKVRFPPRVPPRRPSKPAEIKTEVAEDAEAEQTGKLLQSVTEASTSEGLKPEKRGESSSGDSQNGSEPKIFDSHDSADISPVSDQNFNKNTSSYPSVKLPLRRPGSGDPAAAQVTFGPAVPPSLRTYNIPKGESSGDSQNGSEPKFFDSHDSADISPVSDQNFTKGYVDPWNISSDPPVILPLRRPGSGDPEVLDEEEFGEASANSKYDETAKNPAVELDLMEESGEPRMLFLQLPHRLPHVKRPDTALAEMGAASNSSKSGDPANKGCSLEELPAGEMGKMLVYKSGSIKLKLGDFLYNVSPGTPRGFSEDVVAVNTDDKHCCVLGQLGKHAVVVTPNVDSLLNMSAEQD